MEKHIEREEVSVTEAGPTDNRTSQIVATIAACGFLCALFVALRMFAIRLGHMKVRASDWLIFSAWAFVVGTQIVLGLSINVGNGKHLQEVPDAKALQTNFNIEAILYNFAICLIKLSNLALYASIFPQVVFRRLLWAVGFVVVGWCITTQLITVFTCIPVAAAWDPLLRPGAQCVNDAVLSIASSVVGIATDFAVLLMPIPLVMKLQLKRHLKIIVIGIFVIGSCACIVTIVRLPLTLGLITSTDLSYDAVSVWITTHVELTVGLFATSLPAYRPFLSHISRALNLGWTVGGGSSARSSNRKRSKGSSSDAPTDVPNSYYPSDVGKRHTTHIQAIRKGQDRNERLISVTRDVELLSVPRVSKDRAWLRMDDASSDNGPEEEGGDEDLGRPPTTKEVPRPIGYAQ